MSCSGKSPQAELGSFFFIAHLTFLERTAIVIHPGIYAKGYIIFVFPFVRSSRSWKLPQSVSTKSYVNVSQVQYISPTTHQKAFIFGSWVPWRVCFVTKWIKSCLLQCFGTFKMPILMFISILVFRPEGPIGNPVRRDTRIYVRRILNASRISKTQLNSCTISPS